MMNLWLSRDFVEFRRLLPRLQAAQEQGALRVRFPEVHTAPAELSGELPRWTEEARDLAASLVLQIPIGKTRFRKIASDWLPSFETLHLSDSVLKLSVQCKKAARDWSSVSFECFADQGRLVEFESQVEETTGPPLPSVRQFVEVFQLPVDLRGSQLVHRTGGKAGLVHRGMTTRGYCYVDEDWEVLKERALACLELCEFRSSYHLWLNSAADGLQEPSEVATVWNWLADRKPDLPQAGYKSIAMRFRTLEEAGAIASSGLPWGVVMPLGPLEVSPKATLLLELDAANDENRIVISGSSVPDLSWLSDFHFERGTNKDLRFRRST